MGQPTLHLALGEPAAGRVELRLWNANPLAALSRTLPRADLDGILRRLPGSDPSESDLAPLGQHLYRCLDGPDQLLSNQLALFAGQPAVALAIDGPPALAALPWELLHDGRSFLAEGVNPGVLPVRWRPGAPAPPPANRALSVLFMAASPRGLTPVLDFEAEEAGILRATARFPLVLHVEETGDLDELQVQVRAFGPAALDVVHLTGHADHTDAGPRFLTETATGDPYAASARDLLESLPHRPRLLFLSGCRTAESLPAGAVRSLAEEVLALGLPAVLGWGRPVDDAEASLAAAALYGRLSSGEGLVPSLLATIRDLRQAKSRHWHRLRLFVAGELPAALVTPRTTPERQPAPRPSLAERFLDSQRRVKVAGREAFVGRRRPLQRLLRELRGDDHPAGVVLHGLGGVGKSSLACRLCDRLGSTDFDVLVHVGLLDEPSFLATLAPLARDHAQLTALQGSTEPLGFRLRRFLEQRRTAGQKPLLVVLDDFEANFEGQKPQQDGSLRLDADAAAVLQALAAAIDQVHAARCLVTCRYQLPADLAAGFHQEGLSALRGAELDKKLRALDRQAERTPAARAVPSELRERAVAVADGNPRLLEWLFSLLPRTDLDHAALLQAMESNVREFREQVLAEHLLRTLSAEDRHVLSALLVYRFPVPLPAVEPILPGRTGGELRPRWAGRCQVDRVHICLPALAKSFHGEKLGTTRGKNYCGCGGP